MTIILISIILILITWLTFKPIIDTFGLIYLMKEIIIASSCVISLICIVLFALYKIVI